MSGALARLAVGIALVCACLGAAAAQTIDAVEAERGVVRIIAFAENGSVSSGTGFVIATTPSVFILTNNHVVEGRDRFVVLNESIPTTREDQFDAVLVDRDAGVDLALLRIETDLPVQITPLTLASGIERARSANVYSLGYPGVADAVSREFELQPVATRTEGTIGREFSGTWNNSSSVRIVQHSADINSGNSGGPLLDGCNRVVGVNTARPSASGSSGVFFASAVEEAASFLERNDVVFPTASRPCVTAADGGFTLSPIHLAGGAVALALIGAAAYLVFAGGNGPGTIASVSGTGGGVATGSVQPAQPMPAAAAAPQVRPTGPQMSLRVTTASRHVKRHILPASGFDSAYGVTIGRSKDFADIVVGDPRISKRHARLFRVEGNIFIEDLNASNPTLVDGKPLAPLEVRRLDGGATFTAGDTRFSLQEAS